MPNFAYINNKYLNFNSAKIHIEDRGLQFADSVYEVIAVLDNNLIDLDFHLKRLKYSLRELEIKFIINKKVYVHFLCWSTSWRLIAIITHRATAANLANFVSRLFSNWLHKIHIVTA